MTKEGAGLMRVDSKWACRANRPVEVGEPFPSGPEASRLAEEYFRQATSDNVFRTCCYCWPADGERSSRSSGARQLSVTNEMLINNNIRSPSEAHGGFFVLRKQAYRRSRSEREAGSSSEVPRMRNTMFVPSLSIKRLKISFSHVRERARERGSLT